MSYGFVVPAVGSFCSVDALADQFLIAATPIVDSQADDVREAVRAQVELAQSTALHAAGSHLFGEFVRVTVSGHANATPGQPPPDGFPDWFTVNVNGVVPAVDSTEAAQPEPAPEPAPQPPPEPAPEPAPEPQPAPGQ